MSLLQTKPREICLSDQGFKSLATLPKLKSLKYRTISVNSLSVRLSTGGMPGVE